MKIIIIYYLALLPTNQTREPFTHQLDAAKFLLQKKTVIIF